MISRIILKIHGNYDKRLGAYKITHILERDYGIKVSVGRAYRLIPKLNLPTMFTSKPFIKVSKENCEDIKLCNHLKQEFNPPKPNMVWANDFTYIKVNGVWFYLCIIMDLFSRKIISWNISNKADSNLNMSTFNDAYKTLIIKEIVLLVLCFILTVVLSIQQLPLESFWINLT